MGNIGCIWREMRYARSRRTTRGVMDVDHRGYVAEEPAGEGLRASLRRMFDILLNF
jgi:hypothetical protein